MEEETNHSPKKNRKRKQKFRESYISTFNGIIDSSSRGCYFAHCKLCHVDFTISHGGITDVKRHIETTKHKNSGAISEGNSKISSFFASSNDDGVIKAEVLFSEFIIEHSLPISIADHASKLFKKMFPDSKIVQKYSSGRTKTSYIIDALSLDSKKKIIENLKKSPFSLATDGSTDYEDVKLYPICVRYFDDELGHVLSVLLSLRECGESSTGENIFKIIESELKESGVPWENLVSFATDNASVMVGKHKGVASFLQKESPSVYINGCACHLMHLAASKAAKCLPVNVEDPLIDIYYYLEKSSKRKQTLKQFQEKLKLPVQKILKHVATRWLSLGKCLDRLIVQYPALLAFFEAEVAKELAKEKSSIPKKRKSPESVATSKPAEKPAKMSKLESMKTPDSSSMNSNKSGKEFDLSRYLFKQQEMKKASASSSNSGHASIQSCKKSLSHSSKAPSGHKSNTEKSKSHSSSSSGSKEPSQNSKSNSSSDKSAKESKAKKILSDLKNPNTMLYWYFVSKSIPVFEKANAFLQKEEPCIHTLHKILSDQFADLAMRFVKPHCFSECDSVYDIDFSSRKNQKSDEELFIGSQAREYLQKHEQCDTKSLYSNVRKYYETACDYMLKMFPFGEEVLVNAEFLNVAKRATVRFNQVEYFFDRYDIISSQADKDQLEDEFLHYQCDKLPTEVLQAERLDTAWHLLSQMKDPDTGNNKFSNLCRVAKCVLVIYHSNTDCERIFSIVNKNKTEFRSSLSTKTLGNLMTRKMMMEASDTCCFQTHHSKLLLKKCKSATSEGLKKD